MMQSISRKKISNIIPGNILSIKPVSGGDISKAYLVETNLGKFFMKINSAPIAPQMFLAEKAGLQAIEATHSVAVPHVRLVDEVDGQAFILMDYVESKSPTPADYHRLGEQLAHLHLCTQKEFGFPTDNFIGRLPQSNHPHTCWAEFYWSERILPQLKMANESAWLPAELIPDEGRVLTLFNGIFGVVRPSLLHGDLWGGNYIIAADGTPYLIDPAAYYGHSMVDIAMTRLFGGFGREFYESYHGIIPQTDYYDEQIDFYQLYYLLAHLNLFGRGYYSSVTSILKRYF